MAEAITESLIETIARRLREGKRVRRGLPGGGRVHIDRPLPFVCIYRRPAGRRDAGTERLVVGEGSYLIGAGDEAMQGSLVELVGAVAGALSERFGAVLLIELWSGRHMSHEMIGGGVAARPVFRIIMPAGLEGGAGRTTVAALARGLRRVRILGRNTRVEVESGRPVPPGLPPVLTTAEAGRLGVLMLGVEVPPAYQDPRSGEVFPQMLRELHREISRALEQASFRFAHLQTSHRPEHYLRLGRRAVLRATWEADEELAGIGGGIDLLLAVTPINTDEAFEEFRGGGYQREPTFHYRLLSIDPELLKRRLYAVSLERVEDPALGELLREKRDELDRQITLLQDRNTSRFVHESMQLYGGVEDELLRVAEEVLARVPRQAGGGGGACVDATAFAQRAREEIERYRRTWGEMRAGVELRDDVPGLLVSHGQLLVGQGLRVPEPRVEALIQHEVGTHVLTYYNGLAQPLKLLHTGLPGHEELQEGTAVLAEYLAGGLGRGRLRLLGARVVAVRRLVEGRSFVEVFGELREGHGFSAASAFMIAMRVFRGGGFTKDAVYLRGLMRVLEYLRNGGDAEMLFVGKVSESSLPIVQELRWREVLRAPPLRARHLDMPGAAGRLERVRRGATVMDLVAESERIA